MRYPLVVPNFHPQMTFTIPSIYNLDPLNIFERLKQKDFLVFTERTKCAILVWFLIVSWLRLLIASVTHQRRLIFREEHSVYVRSATLSANVLYNN